MVRLTYRDKKGEAHLHCYQMCADAHEDCNTAYEVDRCQRYVAFRKLADYEDAEEQGLLLRLPCKVGDKLYYIDSYYNVVVPVRLNEVIIQFVGINNYTYQYNCCSFDECGDTYEEYEFNNNDFGKTVFLTREEAEAKLKERGENHEV